MADKAAARPPELSSEATSSLITTFFPFKSVSIDSIKSLPSYNDRNVLFSGTMEESCTQEEEAFVLKMYNRHINTPAVVNGLSAMMLCVSESGIPCCRPIPRREDYQGVETELESCGYDVRYTNILRFIPGTVMDKLDKKYLTAELGYSVGKMAGEMDLALQDFRHPGIDERRLEDWDLMHFTDVRQYVPHLRDEEKRKLANSVVTMYEEHVVPVIPQIKKGVIHNDVSGQNLLFNMSAGKYEFCGLIDFGECVRTCYLFELAIMLAYGMLEKENPVEFVGHMFHGYRDVFPLSREELGCLYYAVLARLCQTAVNGEYRFTLEPWNTYLLTTPSQGWKLINLLESLGKNHMEGIWDVWGK